MKDVPAPMVGPKGSTAPTRSLVWYWGRGGAGARYSDRVGREIAVVHGLQNVAFALHAHNPCTPATRQAGYDVTCISGPQGHDKVPQMLLSTVPRFAGLAAQVRRFRPEVVVLPFSFGLAWPLASLIRAMGPRLIFTVHDAVPHPGDYAQGLQRLTQARLLAAADHIVTPSAFVADELRRLGRLGVAERTTVIPLTRHAKPMALTPRSAPLGPLRLLFLGRLLPYKGLDLLADAMRQLAHRDDWQLTIAGAGASDDSVRAAFAGMPQVDLSRIGYLTEEEVDTLIAGHDLVLCPYTEASQSGVVSEAATWGVPAAVTPVGGLPEQVAGGAAGWVSDAADAASFAGTLELVLDRRGDYPARSAAALALTRQRPGITGWGELVTRVSRQR